MNTCPMSRQLGPYRDSEMDAASRAALEAHLEQCAHCRAELDELAALSRLLAEAPRARLSQMGLYRLHRAAEEAMDRGLVREAGVLSAVAAGILIASAVGLFVAGRSRAEPAAPPPWVELSGWNRDSSSPAASTPAAQWYLANASGRNNEETP